MINWIEICDWLKKESVLQESYTSGELKIIFPEIYSLFGIPQPEEHHPEIDTGVHTIMVLDYSKKISNDPAVWFSAITHDLGKALTPANEWPKHIGHEERGLEPLQHIIDRYNIPDEVTKLAKISCKEHLKAHNSFDMRPGNIIQWFEQLDLFKNPSIFYNFLKVCESDACGRKGFENRQYLQSYLLKEVYELSKSYMTENITQFPSRDLALSAAISNVKHTFVKYSDSQTKKNYLLTKFNLIMPEQKTPSIC